jgi:hypothetical protein
MVLGLLGGSAGPVQAAPIGIDAPWQLFQWHDAPGAWNDEGAFIYSAASWTTVQVTDYRVTGDRFEIYDEGLFVGMTSPPSTIWDYTDDIDVAYADPRWSSGEFLLGPGAHALTIRTVWTAPLEMPGGGWQRNADGTGAIKVNTSDYIPTVPAPAAVLLAALGTVLAGWQRRRHAF